MTTPETFNIGAQAGTNISRGIRQGSENRAIGQILQQAQQIQDPNQLNNIMNQVLPRFSPEGQQVLGQALQRQQQQLQQRQTGESLAGIIGKPELAGNLAGLPSETQNKISTELLKPRLQATDIKALQDAGFTPEEASLYAMASTGGQTEIMKNILENRKRRMGQQEQQLPVPTELQTNELLQNQDVNLTPAEKVKRENERYKTNLPLYNELNKSQKTMKSESRKIDFLSTLNATDKLPKGLGLLNVDKRGNLRLPMFSSPEAQAFQKTINEFMQGAKESFGARITNFEADLFLKRLPTLWNSKEGRTLVLRQMNIVNELNQLNNKGTLDGIQKAGGLRKTDVDKASEYGEIVNKDRIEALEAEYRILENNIDGMSAEKKSLEDILG